MRLSIESLAYGGAGVAHTEDGIAVFVEGACPGDLVDAEVTERHPRHCVARIAELIEPGPDRVEPPCPYARVCGGCQWQHVAIGAQRDAKREALVNAFARIAKLPAAVADVVAAPAELGYRNKVELTAFDTVSGPVLGFARHGSADVVPVDACLLLPPAASRGPRALRGALRYLSARSATRVDRVSLRVATTGDVEVDVWTQPGAFPRQLAAKVLADAVRARTVTRVITKGPAAARSVARVEVLAGRGAWRERLGEDTYLVSAPSFFQVNTRAAEALRTHVTALAAEALPEVIADVYAGVGTFTLPLARIAPVIAVESSSHALADLRRNLESARLDADILPGDAAHALPEIGAVDVAVIDPPRSGLGRDTIATLAATGAGQVVYVSCDPATLARDAALLTAEGYALGSVTPFDLFPQTYHVETVASFSR